MYVMHVGRCVRVCIHICALVCGGQRSTLELVLKLSILYFETLSLTGPGAGSAGRLASKPQGFSASTSTTLELQPATISGFLTWILGD